MMILEELHDNGYLIKLQVNEVLKSTLDEDEFIIDDSALISTNEEYFTTEELFPYDVAFSWVSAECNL